MADTMLVREAAKKWKLTERKVTSLCRERVPLPIGISDYRLAATEYYYIDKTMLIKEFLDERPKVSLFTRPRRFGKTLNMDMLRTFFERTDEDSSVYFRDKKIWNCGSKYRAYQGKYPVIFITFKDVKCETWEETYDKIFRFISLEFERHAELLNNPDFSEFDRKYYYSIVNGNAGENDLQMSLMRLSQMLDQHYSVAPIIIIDEYDTPIQQGYMCGFYDKVILFMRNLFSGGLKDNRHLSYGFLTGILRVAKESIFSGLNNLKVNSVLDNKYSEYFGFTPEEVREMALYYGASEKHSEICDWYDGYRFGKSEIFNPWSVINYFSNECQPRAYWQATGSNDIIGEILAEANADIYEHLQALLQGDSFLTYIDTGVIYPQIKNNPSSVYSFLLVAGYLKVVKCETSSNGDYMCEVAIPNKEISYVYNKEILQKLSAIIPQSTAISIQEALFANNACELQKQLHKLLMQSEKGRESYLRKRFNVNGLCYPEKHYMVKLDEKLSEIKELVDNGDYFVINRARQYGKTTTLWALKDYLRANYTVLLLSFQKMSSAAFRDEYTFVKSFAGELGRLITNKAMNISGIAIYTEESQPHFSP